MDQPETLYPGPLTEKGHWKVLLISGGRCALFSCPVCGRINIIGNLTALAGLSKVQRNVCCRDCRWQAHVILQGWSL